MQIEAICITAISFDASKEKNANKISLVADTEVFKKKIIDLILFFVVVVVVAVFFFWFLAKFR